MKTLDADQRRRAIDAVDTLYWLGLIDEFIRLALKERVDNNTGI